MSKAIKDIEKIAFKEDLEQDIPKSWRNSFKGYILNPNYFYTLLP